MRAMIARLSLLPLFVLPEGARHKIGSNSGTRCLLRTNRVLLTSGTSILSSKRLTMWEPICSELLLI
jgi:hypothetical protein